MKRVGDESDSDSDDSLCSMELSSSSEEEPEEEPQLIAKDTILSLQSRLDAIYATFTPIDSNATPSALLLEFVKNVCFFYFFVESDLVLQEPLATDSNHVLRLKAYKMHYQQTGHLFERKIDELNAILLARVLELIKKRDPNHPLLQVVTQICENSEMHAIRCKNDPMYQRSDDPNVKLITNVPKLNIITDEQWSKDVKEHTHWRKLFFVMDSTAEEAEYDNLDGCKHYGQTLPEDTARIYQNLEYAIATNLNKKTEDSDFGYLFTEEYSEKMRFLHTMIHFPIYVNNYVINMIKSKSKIKVSETTTKEQMLEQIRSKADENAKIGESTTWEQVWEQLMSPQYANAPISVYAKEQKKDLKKRGLSICNAIVHLWNTLLTAEKLCNAAKLATQ